MMEYFFDTRYEKILEKLDTIDPIKYASSRNFINGAVSYLSPYISRGVISLPQIAKHVLQKGYKPYQAEKFLQELAWREYYQRVWQAKGAGIWTDLKQDQADVLHHQIPIALVQANTGIDAVDEGIKALQSTGYLHNHLRMYTASIACNVAKSHWEMPAKWLYYYLLDGDMASNNCSWQWVAGAFSSKKYYCNQENINRYMHTAQRHTFLDNSYEAVAEMDVPHGLKALTVFEAKTSLPNTPAPVIDVSKPTLIYNSYNLDPLWRKDEDVNRVLLLEPSHFAQNPVSDLVIDFVVKLSANIPGLQIFTGEIEDVEALYTSQNVKPVIISKEHPAFMHYPGHKDSREWMFPSVTGYYPSFFSYWKKCSRSVHALAQ